MRAGAPATAAAGPRSSRSPSWPSTRPPSTPTTSPARPAGWARVPDATGVELLAQELREHVAGSVIDTAHSRGKGVLLVEPATIRDVLEHLREKGYTFLASVHGVDYYPQEPRPGVHYELLDMREVDRRTVKVRVPPAEPHMPSITPQWPTADHQEREVYDMFGVI